MPSKDERAAAALRDSQHPTAGRKNVIYVDARRRTRNALVLSQGTTSGLKLRIPTLDVTIDNVPLQTAATSTNCYRSRA
jgi:hypothetical protein